MDILLWLVPAAGATLLAMGWAAWSGHRARRDAESDRRGSSRDDAQGRARLGAALARPVPARALTVVPQAVDRVSGVAVRRTPRDRASGTGAKLRR